MYLVCKEELLMYKAYRFRMYPSECNKVKLNQNIGCTLFVYNHYLDKKNKNYEMFHKNIP